MRRANELASVVAGGLALGAGGLLKLLSYADDVQPDWPGIGPLVFVVSTIAMRIVLLFSARSSRLYLGPVLGGAIAGPIIGATLGGHWYLVHGPFLDTSLHSHVNEGLMLGLPVGVVVGIAATPLVVLAREWRKAGLASAASSVAPSVEASVASKPLFVSGCILGGVAIPVVAWQTFGAPARGLEGFVLMAMAALMLVASRFAPEEEPAVVLAHGPFRMAARPQNEPRDEARDGPRDEARNGPRDEARNGPRDEARRQRGASRRRAFAAFAAVVLLVAMPGLACVHVMWGDHGLHADDETPRRVPALDGAVRSIAVASDVACAHLADRTVRCWGNRAGSLVGDAGWEAERRPRARDGLGPVDRMALTEERMCVIRESGKTRAQCWGFGRSGRSDRGRGPEPGREPDLVPTEVGPPRAREIALAPTFSVAIADDGTVWRWGASSRTALTQVEGIVDAVAIAMGNAKVCALDRAGAVYCWDDGLQPERVNELPGKADRIVMGPDLIAAHVSDDTWWQWGKAYDFAARSLRPVAPHELEDSRGAQDVLLSSPGVCLVTASGAVVCSDGRQPAPRAVLDGASAVAGHDRRACALRPDGVWCWRNH